MTTILNPSSFGKYNGFASKARGFCVLVPAPQNYPTEFVNRVGERSETQAN